MNPSPVLGISACLLGKKVRYDGGHKRSSFVCNTLSQFFEFQEFCPEVESGMGIPRPTIQLRQVDTKPIKLVYSSDASIDVSETMQRYSLQKVESMGHLDGVVVKKGSPSCGMERVPVVVHESGMRQWKGIGMFTDHFLKRWPLIPVEEEGRLNDMAIRENFLERVFALRDWKQIATEQAPSKHQLMQFQAEHKLTLMARGSSYYSELGRMIATTSKHNSSDLDNRYIMQFMRTLAIKPSRGQHVNVLQHILGYFKKDLDTSDKQELLAMFERYRQNQVPLITPIALLRHHLRKRPKPYLLQQSYLNPYPDELALRSSLY